MSPNPALNIGIMLLVTGAIFSTAMFVQESRGILAYLGLVIGLFGISFGGFLAYIGLVGRPSAVFNENS